MIDFILIINFFLIRIVYLVVELIYIRWIDLYEEYWYFNKNLIKLRFLIVVIVFKDNGIICKWFVNWNICDNFYLVNKII